MANLKEKILKSLKSTKEVEPTLNFISKSQENLLKNYSNPVFNQKDRGKLLKSYTDLQNIGKSLYRYGALMDNNYTADAQEEKEDIKNVVLKGGISYYHYVWHSENGENTCDECRELDGKVYEMGEEVPERPHPNCRCTVEIVEGEIETDGEKPQEGKDKIPPRMPTPQPPNPKPTPKPEPSPQPTPQIKVMPVNGPITSPHGWRIHPTYGTRKFHDGVDIGVPINTPIKATTSGKVVMAQWYNGYGKYVEIDHGNNIHSFYGHLNSYDVKVGDIVNTGQVIAKSGNTAGIGKNGKVMTTGPHLHFGVHKNGQSVNPLEFVRNF